MFMKHLRCFFVGFCFVVFCSGVVAAGVDLSELTRIAALKDKDYAEARDAFIKTLDEPVDLNKAVDIGWREGILALFINARADEPEWFEIEFNGAVEELTVSGGIEVTRWNFVRVPSFDDDSYDDKYMAYRRLFALEMVLFQPNWRQLTQAPWRRGILNDIKTSTESGVALSKASGIVVGSLDFWKKLAVKSENLIAQRMAYNTLTIDSGKGTYEILKAKLLEADNSQAVVKTTIMYGLKNFDPDYACELIMETFPVWKQHDNLAICNTAFGVLAEQPESSDSREFVRRVLLNPDESEITLRKAVSTLRFRRKSAIPASEDWECLLEVLNTSTIESVRRQAASKISEAPEEMAVPVLTRVAEKETSPAVLYMCFRGGAKPKNSANIKSSMEQLLSQENASEKEKGNITRVISQINRLDKESK